MNADEIPEATLDELRATRISQAREIAQLRRDLEIQAVNATALLQAQRERDTAIERAMEVQQENARLQCIDREFHNIDDVVEIKRLRDGIDEHMRAVGNNPKAAGHGADEKLWALVTDDVTTPTTGESNG